ncbi:sugar phosphate isomerase/epimerase [Albimonas sp. CAU 1670]|uniref:sugar phosphate isomerase/epimerase family protein n=1 Tax=Albimonas sp. CAU 1670 TaxID=3032599 RepID=UPI0023DB456E|nr:sugar phosphate isomerase/epimerase [Albimonas sp. CAU 1670]MDF2235741.1 sugar phosphate isomerase/epimerase [Albimonas sp. CAU 1670]
MTRPIGLAHLTAIELSPPDLIRAAARVGFDAVGLRLIRVTETSPGYPLMDDPAALRATQAALAETGLAVHDIEFVKIEPDTDPAALDPFLDAGAALGAKEVIAAPYDPDLARLADRIGALAERAEARGIGVSLEFFPWTVVPDLPAALALAEAAGPRVGVLVDSLHFDRSASRLSDLRAAPPARLRFAHLCDAPVHPPYSTEDLLHAARGERLPPGEGGIDLAAFVAALPADLPLSLEVPMTALTAAEGPDAALARVMAGTRALLARRP